MNLIYRIRHILIGTPRGISLGLSLLKLLRTVLGLYTLILSAEWFGTTVDRDCWVLTTSMILIVSQFLFGPIHEIFRARFIYLKEKEGVETAIHAVTSLLSVVVLLCLVVSATLMIFPGSAIRLFAPGFGESDAALLGRMIVLLVPSLVLTELIVLWTALINTYDVFYLPDVFASIPTLGMLAALTWLADDLGIFSLVAGSYAGNVVTIFWLGLSLRKLDRRLVGFSKPNWKLLMTFVVVSAPLYLSYGLGQIQLTLERALCTLLGIGSVSIIDYARKFVDMPIAIILSTLATVLTPVLATHFSKNDLDSFFIQWFKFMRMVVLGFVPVVSVFVLCPEELIRLLLFRGAFGAEQVVSTAETLTWLGVGIVTVSFYGVAAQGMIAQQRSMTYAVVSAAALVLAIALSLLSFRPMGVPGLAMAWSAAHAVAAIVLCYLLTRHQSGAIIQFTKTLAIFGLALIVTFAMVFAVRLALPVGSELALLAVAASGSTLTVLVGICLFQLEEKAQIQSFLKRTFVKTQAKPE